jgi:hypothetical protein
MAEIRLVMKLDGTQDATSLMNQFGGVIAQSVEQGVDKARVSFTSLEAAVRSITPALSNIGIQIAAGMQVANQQIAILTERLSQLGRQAQTVKAQLGSAFNQAGGLDINEILGNVYGGGRSPQNLTRALADRAAQFQYERLPGRGYPGVSEFQYQRYLSEGYAGGGGQRVGGRIVPGQTPLTVSEQTRAAAERYGGPRDDLEAKVNQMLQSINIEAAEQKRQSQTNARAAEQAQRAAEQQQKITSSAFASAAGRREALSGFAADASAEEAARRRGTAGAVSRYEGAPVDVDALVGNIMGQGKLQGAAARAAQRADAAAEKAAQKEFDGIVRAIEQMGEQEKAEGQRIAAAQALRARGASEASQYLGTGGIFSPGYRRTSQQVDASGNPINETFNRSAGLFSNASSFTRNNATGEVSARNIQEMSSAWSRFVHSVTGDGGKVSQSLHLMTAPLKLFGTAISEVDSLWRSLGNNLIRVSALFYSARRTFELARGATVSPYEAIISQGENAEKFRQQISTTVGGYGTAAAVDQSLLGLQRSSPFSLEQTRAMAGRLIAIPSLSSQLALGGPENAPKVVSQLTDIVARLSIGNPQAAPEEIARAVGNALEGNLRGLRLEARINPRDLAQAAGVTEKELSSDRDAILRGLTGVSRARVGDSELAARTNLPSVQLQKIESEWNHMLERIALESNLFGDVSEKFHSMLQAMIKYSDSDAFRARAKAIGDDLAHIFDSVLAAGQKFLQSISGASSSALRISCHREATTFLNSRPNWEVRSIQLLKPSKSSSRGSCRYPKQSQRERPGSRIMGLAQPTNTTNR